MTYWLNLFAGTTWKEFQQAGGTVTGFRKSSWNRAKPIKLGDFFLCYIVGVKRWVGLLEVIKGIHRDETPIFGEKALPIRFGVNSVAMTSPEYGVPMEALAGKLSLFPEGGTARQWSVLVRSSANRLKTEAGEAIAAAIKEAVANPVERPVNAKQLERPANLVKIKAKAGNQVVETVVTIPTKEEDQIPAKLVAFEEPGPSHTEIQWRLLNLGSQMGLNVWAPKADRPRVWNGKLVGGVPKLLDKLPTTFDGSRPGRSRTSTCSG